MLPGPTNQFHWDGESFKEIIGFGKWVFLSSVLGFLVFNGDRLLIGAYANSHQLGVYSIAFLFASFPQLIVTQLAGRVAFPALSEVARNDPKRLKETYYKFRLPFDLFTLSISGMLATAGSQLIHILYDSRYHTGGPILEILAIALIAGRFQLTEQCYLALGKPKLLTPLYIARLICLYTAVPLTFMTSGFNAAVWAIALTPFVTLPIIFYFKHKAGLLSLRRELLALPIFLTGAALGYLCTAAQLP